MNAARQLLFFSILSLTSARIIPDDAELPISAHDDDASFPAVDPACRRKYKRQLTLDPPSKWTHQGNHQETAHPSPWSTPLFSLSLSLLSSPWPSPTPPRPAGAPAAVAVPVSVPAALPHGVQDDLAVPGQLQPPDPHPPIPDAQLAPHATRPAPPPPAALAVRP